MSKLVWMLNRKTGMAGLGAKKFIHSTAGFCQNEIEEDAGSRASM